MAQVLPNVECDIDWENLPVKDAYVMGFQPGDLVQTIHLLHPRSRAGAPIPAYSVGTVKAVTLNSTLVHFLFYGDCWIIADALEFAHDYHLAPTRRATERESGPKR